VKDLLREAFIGVRLDHENIVQVLDLGEHEGILEYQRTGRRPRFAAGSAAL